MTKERKGRERSESSFYRSVVSLQSPPLREKGVERGIPSSAVTLDRKAGSFV